MSAGTDARGRMLAGLPVTEPHGGVAEMVSYSKLNSRTVVAAASLAVGPLLMSIGDLIHPEEKMDAADQAAVIAEHASRWYAAHLLLFIGLLALIPGVLALTGGLAAARKPAPGHAARVLLLIGAATFTPIFVAEMLIGRYVADGASTGAAADLLGTFQSGPVLGVMAAGGLAFFAGVAAFVLPFVMTPGPLRGPAAAFALGALLILAEIISAQVLLSQIGNLAILGASVAFAWHFVQGDRSATVTSIEKEKRTR